MNPLGRDPAHKEDSLLSLNFKHFYMLSLLSSSRTLDRVGGDLFRSLAAVVVTNRGPAPNKRASATLAWQRQKRRSSYYTLETRKSTVSLTISLEFRGPYVTPHGSLLPRPDRRASSPLSRIVAAGGPRGVARQQAAAPQPAVMH